MEARGVKLRPILTPGTNCAPNSTQFSGEHFMSAQHVTDYERKWIEALNRGDVSMADEVFTPDCVIHHW
jgi:hypothetical protein